MEKPGVINHATYKHTCFILTTKHAKSIAIAPVFSEKLGAGVIEYVVDTDQLGTFTGEIARPGSALDCARQKCEWSLHQLGPHVQFALASEGSFGPHPYLPFIPCDHEILYFIDKKRKFHLYVSLISENTNFNQAKIHSLEQLHDFAKQTKFPSHALILRPTPHHLLSFKGLNSIDALEQAFKECLRHTEDKTVCVSTDMRAQFNPSRMQVIRELTDTLAERLITCCPQCATPGFGLVRQEKGLACADCGFETNIIKRDVYGCTRCDYEEETLPLHGKKTAEPMYCPQCNP